MHTPIFRRNAVHCLIVAAAVGLFVCEALAEPDRGRPVPVPRARPAASAEEAAPAKPLTRSLAVGNPSAAAVHAVGPADLAALKRAMDLIHRRAFTEALEIENSLQDSAARKLIEWAFLRSDDGGADFGRYVAFIEANPGWPSVGLMRRRAEGTLWDEGASAATVRSYFASSGPITAKGRFALARALIAQGDRASAQQLVREAWRADPFSQETESQALQEFRDLIGPADHMGRMDRRLYANDTEAAMRAAHRLGDTALAIAHARIAVNTKSGNALQLLDAVSADGRQDPGYMFSRIQFMRRNDRIAEAAQLMLAVPRIDGLAHDLDEWWVERRLVARKLLDVGDPRAAYQVARDAVPPPKENYRGEHQFTAGWIALRFLNEPSLALGHFVKIAEGVSNPITLARSEYWQGRALEAMGRRGEAQAHFQAAARFPTAYYGQIARAHLGYGEIALNPPPAHRVGPAGLEVVRAVDMLYSIGERNLVIPFVADLAERNGDPAALALVAEIAERHNDARSMLLVGKTALGRGYALDHYAFPCIGVPSFAHVGPEIDRSVVYSIVRQESAFNPGDYSSAHAMGLMQVTPEAGRYVAKKFNIRYDVTRLKSDMVYNTQMGAAELGDLLVDYRGSYILAFAGYNAGRGRVKEWVAKYGDPRDPEVDPIDWVERIPFSETRNYVQRVLENLQVYRVRLGHGSRLMIEADLRRGSSSN